MEKKIWGDYFVAKEEVKLSDVSKDKSSEKNEKKYKYFVRRYFYVLDGDKKTKDSSRYPASKYQHLKSKEEIENLVIRLNGRESWKKLRAIKAKLAFLPTEVLEEFRILLENEIPTEKDARYHYRNLHRYFLKFFVDLCGLIDPNEWKTKQALWGLALLRRLPADQKQFNIFEEEMSYKTIKGLIHLANRFMVFIHEKNPQEIPLFKFTPISSAMLKDYLARQEMNGEEVGQFISDNDWKKIDKELPQDIGCFIRLGYYYGLRRGETLGLQVEDVRNGHLSIERQISKSNGNGECSFKPLKDRDFRKTPHWFLTKEKAYELVEEGAAKRIHPDTLGVKFASLMRRLKMSYELHDLRRTFITKSLDEHKPREVMLAVSHSNIETTMKYLRDDRQSDDTVFKPKKRA